MKIQVPDHLAETFLTFLDVAQAAITDEDAAQCSDNEQECLAFVRSLLGDKASMPYRNRNQATKAAQELATICSPK